MACVTSMSVPRHTVAVLGSGIAGLSTAYYIHRKFGPSVRPIIFESKSRSGGWVRSIKHENIVYEVGPRTIRPHGVQGKNTLDLIEEIGLDGSINFVPQAHPSARNRFVYFNGKLERIPLEFSALWKTSPLFGEPILLILLKEMFKKPKIAPDESLHSFIARRFSPHIADHIIDPLMRGICAGDARNISVKFFAPFLYEKEQQGRSITGSNFLAPFRKGETEDPLAKFFPPNSGFEKIGGSTLATVAIKQEKWSVWTLEDGLESLPTTLENKLTAAGVEIFKNSPVQSITFNVSDDDVESKNLVEYLDPTTNTMKTVECSHIISALPSFELAKVLRRNPQQQLSKPTKVTRAAVTTADKCSPLIEFLDKIPSADVTVTNLKYNKPLSCPPAFGFLVPSNQPDVKGLLGVVFNHCSFPQPGGESILTAMSQGINENTIHKYIEKILGLTNPLYVNKCELHKCIPQYTVGHYERLADARSFIKGQNLPLTLVGASYDGVSVNDCIIRGRIASENLPFDLYRPA